mmetsp:Transcript_20764/g.43660  ORF Transcript_20764/g.43660 Transcript_20764/m.43660 type:complete len:105 (-) Transcript_20764:1064-1378(-)
MRFSFPPTRASSNRNKDAATRGNLEYMAKSRKEDMMVLFDICDRVSAIVVVAESGVVVDVGVLESEMHVPSSVSSLSVEEQEETGESLGRGGGTPKKMAPFLTM